MLLKRNQTAINLRISLQRDFVQILNKNVFAAGDSVEAFDYSPETRQLVISSHYGHGISVQSHRRRVELCLVEGTPGFDS